MYNLGLKFKTRKTFVNQNQGWEPHPLKKNTRQMRTQVDTTQREKQKQTNQHHQAS